MLRIAIGGGIGCFGDAFWADHRRGRRSKRSIHIVCRIGELAKN